jgi:CO/xanthine dehydrogenase FAD-binding subunit
VTTKAYFQPQSLREALGLLEQHGSRLLVMAGGTLAVPLVNKGVSKPEQVMGLRRAGLDYVRQVDGAVHIGAAATLTKVRQEAGIPILAEAVKNIGAWAVQNMGTAGGNLSRPRRRRPGATFWRGCQDRWSAPAEVNPDPAGGVTLDSPRFWSGRAGCWSSSTPVGGPCSNWAGSDEHASNRERRGHVIGTTAGLETSASPSTRSARIRCEL